MDKLLIAPIGEGLKTDIVPFMAPEDSFQTLENAFIFNGSIRRKPTIYRQEDATTILESRLRMLLGVILPDGSLVGNVPAGIGKLGQQFSVGNTLYTVYQVAGNTYVAPADGSACTYDIATKAYTFAGCVPGTAVYFYPCLKVHHIYTPLSNVSSIYFDTSYSYLLGATGFEYLDNGDSTWANDNLCKYSSDLYNYGSQARLVVASLSATRGSLKYFRYDNNFWYNWTPKFLVAGGPGGNVVTKCGLVKKFARRLLLFNTWEYDGVNPAVHHRNRIRYSEAGEAYNADSWHQYPDTIDKGGYIDLPSGETITAVEILNGRLVVFCENSIYSIVYSGNKFYPFGVSTIDANIGSASNTVPEIGGKLVFINSYGLYYCDGIRTEAISNKINTIFTNGIFWVPGATLFLDQTYSLLYITLRRSTEANDYYTDTVLLYNFINDTYSLLYDNYTTIGLTNVDRDLVKYSSPKMIVGNANGYMANISPDVNKSGISLNVENLAKPDANHIDLEIFNHTFNRSHSYAIEITNSALAGLNGSYIVEYVNDTTMRIENDNAIVGYAGDAYVSIVDRIDISTKAFAPYLKDGKGVSISKVMFNVGKTVDNGRFIVRAAAASSVFDADLGKYVETQSYNLLENSLFRVWRSVNLQSSAETVMLQFAFDDDTLLDDTLPFQIFLINAIILYASPTRLF